jgi:hypothetical protein
MEVAVVVSVVVVVLGVLFYRSGVNVSVLYFAASKVAAWWRAAVAALLNQHPLARGHALLEMRQRSFLRQ